MDVLDDALLGDIFRLGGVQDILACSGVYNGIITSSIPIQLILYRHLLEPRRSSQDFQDTFREDQSDERCLRCLIRRDEAIRDLRPRHYTVELPEDQVIIAASNRYIITKYSDYRAMFSSQRNYADAPFTIQPNGHHLLLTIWTIHRGSDPPSPEGSEGIEGSEGSGGRSGEVQIARLSQQRIYVPFNPDLNTLVVSLEKDLIAVPEDTSRFSGDTRSNTVHLFHLLNHENGIATRKGKRTIDVHFEAERSNAHVRLHSGPGRVMRITRAGQTIIMDWDSGEILGILITPPNISTTTKIFLSEKTIICNISWPSSATHAPPSHSAAQQTAEKYSYIAIYDIESLPKDQVGPPNVSQPTLILRLPSSASDLPRHISDRLRPRTDNVIPGDDGLIGNTTISDTSGLGYLHLVAEVNVVELSSEGESSDAKRGSLCIRITEKGLNQIGVLARALTLHSMISYNKQKTSLNPHGRIRTIFPHVPIVEPAGWLKFSVTFIEPELQPLSIVGAHEDKVFCVNADPPVLGDSLGNRQQSSGVHLILQDLRTAGEDHEIGVGLGGLGNKLDLGSEDNTEEDTPRILQRYHRRVERITHDASQSIKRRRHGVTISEAGLPDMTKRIDEAHFNGHTLVLQYSSGWLQGTTVDIFDFDRHSSSCV
ncbi:uncharacterized protein I303_106255 [Kwoniella dejecticola CBS 10117]|uniref:Uncharacterized protein n=1 Tax=Kwoniella dejecticola CBS 10117 TaxID=1296121 RepID=A0A1A6A1P9_9TREE|nr:uncharacterized protein I303_06274 [Kwoniella dejecticola CBS 10117]OBR83987.1 hypothetical protein I303_06274 [Kwoniella dejecticola CBS 10117]